MIKFLILKLRYIMLYLKVAEVSPVIKEGLLSGKLVARESGQASPCLDLSRLNHQLAEDMKQECHVSINISNVVKFFIHSY